jgi:hypothetical protein
MGKCERANVTLILKGQTFSSMSLYTALKSTEPYLL